MPERPVLRPGWVNVTLMPDGFGGETLYVDGYRVAGLKPLGVQRARWEKAVRVDAIAAALPRENPDA